MASTYTTLLRTEQQASGENNNSWGTKLNVVTTLLEEAIAGMESMAVTGGTKTLTAVDGVSDESRNAILKFTGTLTSNQTIVVPDTSKPYIIWNSTSGDYTLTVKTASGTGVAVPQGEKTLVFCDGTNVEEVFSETLKQGKHTLYIPAAAMRPATTNGAGSLTTTEVSSNKPEVVSMPFDKDSDEYALFGIALPKSWNEGTVTFKPFWTANSVATDDVVWGLQGVSVADGESVAGTFGTAQTVTDSHGGTTYQLMIGPESSDITISGTPAEGEMQYFRVFRDADNVADTLDADALLIGMQIIITINAANDE